MLKQRPVLYLALATVLGGLLLAGVPINRVLLIGVIVFMLMMHLGGHGGHSGHSGHGGSGGHGDSGNEDRPVVQGQDAPARDKRWDSKDGA